MQTLRWLAKGLLTSSLIKLDQCRIRTILTLLTSVVSAGTPLIATTTLWLKVAAAMEACSSFISCVSGSGSRLKWQPKRLLNSPPTFGIALSARSAKLCLIWSSKQSRFDSDTLSLTFLLPRKKITLCLSRSDLTRTRLSSFIYWHQTLKHKTLNLAGVMTRKYVSLISRCPDSMPKLNLMAKVSWSRTACPSSERLFRFRMSWYSSRTKPGSSKWDALWWMWAWGQSKEWRQTQMQLCGQRRKRWGSSSRQLNWTSTATICKTININLRKSWPTLTLPISILDRWRWCTSS